MQGSNSPYPAPKGYLQVETGVSYSNSLFDFPKVVNAMKIRFGYDSPDNPLEKKIIKQYQLPEFLFKYGITDRLEVRAGSVLQHSKVDFGPNTSPISPETYLQDWGFGLKYRALESNNSKGILSFLIESNIPGSRTGEHIIRSEWVLFGGAIGSYTFTKWLQISGNLGIKRESFPHNKPLQPNWAFLTFFNLTDNFSLFTEWHGARSTTFDYDNWGYYDKYFHKLDGGFLYLINKNLQTDISGGIGLTEDVSTYRYHLSTGLSWRTKLL